MCACVYERMYVYVHPFVCVCKSLFFGEMNRRVCACVSVCMWVFLCVCMFICIHLCVCVSVTTGEHLISPWRLTAECEDSDGLCRGDELVMSGSSEWHLCVCVCVYVCVCACMCVSRMTPPEYYLELKLCCSVSSFPYVKV